MPNLGKLTQGVPEILRSRMHGQKYMMPLVTADASAEIKAAETALRHLQS